MRFLSFHCDYFGYKTTNKSRSKIIEDLTDENREGRLENVVVLFISVEKQDESDPNVFQEFAKQVDDISSQLKVNNIVLLSFAHLFGELSSPEFGFKALVQLEKLLKEKYTVLKPPFGWFNELELKAKGHPLSRISRKIN